MGNIVNLRTRLEALEQKRGAKAEMTRAERDAANRAYVEELERMSGVEFNAAEAKALAEIEPGDMQANRRTSSAAFFRTVREERHARPNPTPPHAA